MDTRLIRLHELLLFILAVAWIAPPTLAWSSAEETSLRSSLEIGYEDDVRPSEVTSIYMAFQLISIDGLNIKAQTFSVSGWWILEWEDNRLVWNSASNGNIDYLQYYEDDLWTPAIVVSNSVSTLSAIDEDTIPLRVKSDGSVAWHPPGIFVVNCEIDSTYFPFDTQTCYIEVTSFGYTLNDVNVNSTRGLRLDYYAESGDWKILDKWDKYDTFDDNGDSYAKMTYYLKLKRLNLYHWFNVILPVIISSLLLIFVYLLPVDSGEKMGYILTCLLTYVVLLTLIAADMPTSAKHTSVLEVYLTIVLLVSGFTTFACIVSIKLYRWPDDTDIPRFVLVMTKKCWPWVDRRPDPEMNKTSQKVHPRNIDYEKENTLQIPKGFADKDIHTPVRRLSVASDRYKDEDITGQIASRVMDSVLFRIYAVFIPTLAFVFLIILVTG